MTNDRYRDIGEYGQGRNFSEIGTRIAGLVREMYALSNLPLTVPVIAEGRQIQIIADIVSMCCFAPGDNIAHLTAGLSGKYDEDSSKRRAREIIEEFTDIDFSAEDLTRKVLTWRATGHEVVSGILIGHDLTSNQDAIELFGAPTLTPDEAKFFLKRAALTE